MSKIEYPKIVYDTAQDIFERYHFHCIESLRDQFSRLYVYTMTDEKFLENVEYQISRLDTGSWPSPVGSETDNFRRSFISMMAAQQNPQWCSIGLFKNAIIEYMKKHHPEIMRLSNRKYRKITDPWEPAW